MINEKINITSEFYNLDTFTDINDMINEILTNNKNHINFYDDKKDYLHKLKTLLVNNNFL